MMVAMPMTAPPPAMSHLPRLRGRPVVLPLMAKAAHQVGSSLISLTWKPTMTSPPVPLLVETSSECLRTIREPQRRVLNRTTPAQLEGNLFGGPGSRLSQAHLHWRQRPAVSTRFSEFIQEPISAVSHWLLPTITLVITSP